MAYIAVVAIIAWAIVSVASIRSKGGGGSAALRGEVDRLAAALEASSAERERLTQRVQNLEAIATAEPLDATQPLDAAEPPRLELPDEPSPEQEAARLARRTRRTRS